MLIRTMFSLALAITALNTYAADIKPTAAPHDMNNMHKGNMHGSKMHNDSMMCKEHGNHTMQMEKDNNVHTFFMNMDKLNLTDDQKKQIDEIHNSFMPAHHNKAKPMQPEALKASHKTMLEKMTAVLTPEQQKKLTELMPK